MPTEKKYFYLTGVPDPIRLPVSKMATIVLNSGSYESHIRNGHSTIKIPSGTDQVLKSLDPKRLALVTTLMQNALNDASKVTLKPKK